MIPNLTPAKSRKQASVVPNGRIWNADQVAARLGKGDSWFYAHRRRLEQLGFPPRDRDLGGWDSVAIEAWLDRRAGVDSNNAVEADMLRVING